MVAARFRRSEWDSAVGASGTLRVASDILLARGAVDGLITRKGIAALVDECLAAGDVTRLKMPGLTADRQEIFPAGLAILIEVFDRLGVESMRVADGALREGLLYDLLGRLTDEDARARSVRAMEGRYHVDIAQAERVEATALAFLRQVRDTWGLEAPLAELVLRWAARVHEVGLDISHSHYHRHGAYLLQFADLPGFPREEQHLLAVIVGGHRRKLNLESIEELIPPWHLKAEFLIVLLRLAVLLHRGRSPGALPDIDLRARARTLEVAFPKGWLAEHPLTAADLEQEIDYLQASGFRLKVA